MLTLGLLLALLLALIGLVAGLAAMHNALVSEQRELRRSWGEIDSLFKRRQDEIPRLLKACEGFTQREHDVFVRLLDLRGRAQAAPTIAAKAAIEEELLALLGSIFALADNLPELKNREAFRQSQDRLREFAAQIARRRDAYNAGVLRFNLKIQTPPHSFVANFASMAPHEPFKAAGTDLCDA
ncbi:MAG: LemA family protein [Elusimicrobia bacterium]|nr:LemA family protein [Elusimicrobiota bacterium]